MDDFQTGLPGLSPLYGSAIRRTVGLCTGACMHRVSHMVGQEKTWSVMMYDTMGRVSRKETSFPDGVTISEDVEYSFLGDPVHRFREQSYPSRDDSDTMELLTEDILYTYDHAERLIEVTHSLNGGSPVVLAHNIYDELGRLTETGRGASGRLSSSYSYNVRSWMTSIGGALFMENLHYETLRGFDAPASGRRYGGGLSSMEWKAFGDSGLRSYDYTYDGAGRLVSAAYGELGYRMTGYGAEYEYDCMGNLLHLRRDGDRAGTLNGMVDDLTLTYDGNRLVSVSDAAPASGVPGSMDFSDGAADAVEYTYDGNGAMTSDLNRGMSLISYGKTGMPSLLVHGSRLDQRTCLADETIYDRTVGRPMFYSSTTSYRANVVYEDGIPKYVLFDGGLISLGEDSSEYVFFLRDHLGSTRVAATSGGDVVQVNHYYPFGGSYATGRMASDLDSHLGDVIEAYPAYTSDALGNASIQPYRFIGNELYSESGIYDFHARMYDPVLGRFLSVDPLAEKYTSLSPYDYCGNDPIAIVDPMGSDWYTDDSGKYIWIAGHEQYDGLLNVGDRFENNGMYYSLLGAVVSNTENYPMADIYKAIDDLIIRYIHAVDYVSDSSLNLESPNSTTYFCFPGLDNPIAFYYRGKNFTSIKDGTLLFPSKEASFRNMKIRSGHYIQVDTFPDGKAKAYGGINKSAYTYKQWPASHWLIGVSLETNGHPLQIRFDEKNAKAFIDDVNKQLR